MYTITDIEFEKLSNYIKANYGINLKDEKKTLVEGRLSNVLIENNFKNFSEYYDFIIADKSGTAATNLVNRITTNHTFFMREPTHFTFFGNKILPDFKSSCRNRDLRIWSAGCSTGEEPYTLAMIVDEFFGHEKTLWDAKILATDISNKALERAKKGIYSQEAIQKLPPHWRLNYFNKLGMDRFELINRIRDEVIYRRFNLMDETFPFKKKFHVIFCRNVMIYFDAQTKDELVKKFYDSMEYGGYLFIGHSESLSREETKFRYLMPAVYRKE